MAGHFRPRLLTPYYLKSLWINQPQMDGKLAALKEELAAAKAEGKEKKVGRW